MEAKKRRISFKVNPQEQEKLAQLEAIRPDLQGYDTVTKVHIGLQEWFKANFEQAREKGLKMPAIRNRTMGPECSMAYISISDQKGNSLYIALKHISVPFIKSDRSLPDSLTGGANNENISKVMDQDKPEKPIHQLRRSTNHI